MKAKICLTGALAAAFVFVMQPTQTADADSRGAIRGGGVAGVPSKAPDVLCSRIGLAWSGSNNDIAYNGQSGGISAFSMASTSCNLGNIPAEWMNSGARNPVIAQNLYRYHEGRFEHIGMSWLKHSFCAVSEPTCSTCSSTPCSTLGVGCADTYTSGHNGDQSTLGPRWNKNPLGQGAGGVHNDQYNSPQGPNAIRGRLQVRHADIITGAQYVAEIQYVTHDEPLAYRYNNASYRRVNLTTTSMTGFAGGQSSVAMGKAAIFAWKEVFDSDVEIVPVNDGEEGRYNVGYRVYDNGDGTWTYEYAIHNLNSRRAAGAISLPVEDGVNVTDIGFHSPAYHSGDGINYVTFPNTAWATAHSGDLFRWATTPHAQDANANALRWGSLYNYRFTADVAPVAGQLNIEMFMPGAGPDSIGVNVLVPGPAPVQPCPGDLNDDAAVDVQDLLVLLGAWGPCGNCAADLNNDGAVDVLDLLVLLGNWGPCN